ncbi:MAG: hypothetical protein E1N59_1360 [Puniceicoccaceae bacterium 5H]|nr:MAG: hypothetical protein E1N59_1360 [Puniceicoccaceae bacterium 5H]
MLLHYRELIEKAAGTAGIGKLAVYAERQRRSMGQALTMISVSKGKALEEAWGLWQDTADEAHQQISLLAHYMGHPHATHELSYG